MRSGAGENERSPGAALTPVHVPRSLDSSDSRAKPVALASLHRPAPRLPTPGGARWRSATPARCDRWVRGQGRGALGRGWCSRARPRGAPRRRWSEPGCPTAGRWQRRTRHSARASGSRTRQPTGRRFAGQAAPRGHRRRSSRARTPVGRGHRRSGRGRKPLHDEDGAPPRLRERREHHEANWSHGVGVGRFTGDRTTIACWRRAWFSASSSSRERKRSRRGSTAIPPGHRSIRRERGPSSPGWRGPRHPGERGRRRGR